ncbi:MAG TPA: NAD(P)/FAD-dependent oxidoreductase, partial [Lapillicoccus sp.]|nr:NAD(P)/FAD-dependent oxidoreductase [Lapillicoccus sp.]
HAQRQGVRAGANIAAACGKGERKPYEHHDLGFVVDLGGWTSAADPLHVPLSGLPAKAVTRGYHLVAMPGNRGRTVVSWLTEAAFGRQGVQLGLVRGHDVPLDTDTPMGAVTPKS